MQPRPRSTGSPFRRRPSTASPRSSRRGPSLIISDEALSRETGKGTDFVVLMSGEPQGGIKIRRRPQPWGGDYERPYGRSPYGYGRGPSFWW